MVHCCTISDGVTDVTNNICMYISSTFSRCFCYDDSFFFFCLLVEESLFYFVYLKFYFCAVFLWFCCRCLFLFGIVVREDSLPWDVVAHKKQPSPLMHLIGCETSLLEDNLQTAFPSHPLLHVEANQALQLFKHHYNHYVLQMAKFHSYICHSTFFDFPFKFFTLLHFSFSAVSCSFSWQSLLLFHYLFSSSWCCHFFHMLWLL